MSYVSTQALGREVDNITEYIEMNDLARGRAKGQLPQQKRSCWRWRVVVSRLPIPALQPIRPSLWLHRKATVCPCSVKPSQITPATDPSPSLSTASSGFGPPGNQIRRAFEVCSPRHCKVAHSQNFWPCSGRPLWRPTRNARGESSLVIKLLYHSYQYWPHLSQGHRINFCHQIYIH